MITDPHQRMIPAPLEGVKACSVRLGHGPWADLAAALQAHFPQIDRATWLSRLARGRVLDADGCPLAPGSPPHAGSLIYYYREVEHEPQVPGIERLLHLDQDLAVVDKPAGLPVQPAGRYLRQSLLWRLVQRLDNPELTPLHRIDRDTSGLVMFSCRAQTRAIYHRLFAERRIDKRYLALAPLLHQADWPLIRRSRIVRGEPFFRMREAEGPANSETRITLIGRQNDFGLYELRPISGRKHQLRVHLAALGAPICGDQVYPWQAERVGTDDQRPLQLLASTLDFVDPISGAARSFRSPLRLPLSWPA